VVSGRDFLGPYRLIRLVRAGQQTQVWETVKDGETERIAMKLLVRDQIKNKEEIAQLKHEAMVGVPLQHPNIIDIYEFNFEYELPFVAMELFNARNLKQDLREQSDRIAHLVPDIIKQAAEALGYLHLKGWVHCDVKPDNFLVKDDGTLKLIDFSIAQKAKKGLGGLFGGRKIQGTRSYMSPEQIRGRAMDPRSDIYSFGCVMFELLAGRPPYTAVNPNELLTKHLKAAIPSLATMNEAVTPEFTALVQKMMSKERDQRHPDMNTFLKEFHSIRVYRTGMKPVAPAEFEEADEDE